MRKPTTALITIAVSACAPHQQTLKPLKATIVTAVEENCDKPGVRIDAIRQVAVNREIQVEDRDGPLELEPGRYEISVACQNPLDEKSGKCVFWGHPNKYPTYHLILKAGTRYSFRCFVDGPDLLYRVSEGDSSEHP